MNNWQVKKLGDVVNVSNGTWGPADNQGTAVLRSTNFTNEGILSYKDVAYREIPEKKVSELALNEGDILLEKSGGSPAQPVGRVVYFDKQFDKRIVFGNFISRLRPSKVNSKYLFYYLLLLYKKGYTNKLQNQTTGIRNLILKKYLDIEVSLPSDSVQKQIVERLDIIKKLQELNQKEIETVEELFNSLVRKLILKRIKEWEVKSIGEINIKVGSGSTPRGGKNVYKNNGIYFIRSQNVMMNGLDFSDIVYIDTTINERMSRTKVLPNDVLLNITGASIGRVAVFPEEYVTANVNQHVCIIRLKPNVSPRYICFYLSSLEGQKQIFSMQSGATRQGLNFEQVRKIIIPMPTYIEQQNIVEKLETVKTYKRKLVEKKSGLQELFESTLNKAIRGDLSN